MASGAASALTAFSDKVQIPTQHNAVFNEECLFSFDSPESPDGLYVCMEKFIGLGREHVAAYHNRTSNAIFLHRKRTKVPKADDDGEAKKDSGEVGEREREYSVSHPLVLLNVFG